MVPGHTINNMEKSHPVQLMQLLVHTNEAEYHTKAFGIHTLDNLILFDVGILLYKITAPPVIFISSLSTATVFTSQCKSSTVL